VLLATLFPTLQGWREKGWWDKLVSLVSVPSILLLVVTLPVVETEGDGGDEEEEAVVVDTPEVGRLQQQQEGNGNGVMVAPPSVAVSMSMDDGGVPPETETEWQAYRRRTRSVTSRSPFSVSPLSLSPSPSSLSLNTPLPPPGEQVPRLVDLQESFINVPVPKPAGPDSDHITTALEAPVSSGWNRWLVAVQLFTGPFFVVLIVWLNMADDFEQPGKTLVKMVLYSLLFSLCLLAALLLTTTEQKKPRYHFLLCYLGFVISVAWISTIAGEVVGVLKAFGVILDISEAILGLTIFAVGNSLGDLVADVTVARLGYPVMAL
jgi:sodium/potassium/calcium exchanger 6